MKPSLEAIALKGDALSNKKNGTPIPLIEESSHQKLTQFTSLMYSPNKNYSPKKELQSKCNSFGTYSSACNVECQCTGLTSRSCAPVDQALSPNTPILVINYYTRNNMTGLWNAW